MADEPTLPRLPHPLPNGRKRGRINDSAPSYHSSASSDPAVFSSDDDPALDNYQSYGRRKKRYVGPWFDQQPASSDSAVGDETLPSYPPPRRNRGLPQPQKREFRRQLDSGVWMGTDGSLTDTDDSFDMEPPAARLALLPAPVQVSVPISPARPRLSPEEQAAQNVIRSCIDDGSESVDLSGLGLESISEGLLDPIADIAPIPTVAKDVPFEQRDAQIQVFLSNNRLRSFPAALFNIEHLTVLTLRANRLVEIPPAISKLKNLETLNIGQNYLRFLPGELLSLLRQGSKLRNLNFAPNRFWQPDTTPDHNPLGADAYERLTFGHQPDIKIEASWCGLTTRLHSRTPVHFSTSAHPHFSRFRLPSLDAKGVSDAPLELEPFTALETPRALCPGDRRALPPDSKLLNPRGAKSLFELAIKACAASPQAERIPGWLSEDGGWPAHVAPAVQRAVEIGRKGGEWCAVCGRETVMPVVKWVEFRYIGRTTVSVDAEGLVLSRFAALGDVGEGGLLLPFLRVGCSWRCVPRKVE